jgi:hypothetical protein
MRHIAIKHVRTSIPLALIAFGFALSVAANVLLWRAAHTLAAQYNEYRSEAEAGPPSGVQLPPLIGKGVSGEPLRIDYQATEYTLLLIFNPTCPYCIQNWPHWSRLQALIRPGISRLVAVDLTGRSDAEYRRIHRLEAVPFFTALDYATTAAYKIELVPTTMLIRADGTLQHTWIGVLDPDAIAALETVLQGSSVESANSAPPARRTNQFVQSTPK